MLKKRIFTLFISCVLGACAAPSTDQRSGDGDGGTRRNDCIHEPSIRGYTVLDEQNLIVEASGRRQYHVVLRSRAHGLRHSHVIVFDATTSRVCAGFDGISYEGAYSPIRISMIRELTKEEEEDLLIQFGKKEPEIEHTPSPGEVEGADVEELDLATSE